MPAADAADAIALARRFAALSGPFEPSALGSALGDLGVGVGVGVDLVVTVTAALADVCDTGAGDGRWLMRNSPRQRALAAMEDVAAEVEWRRALPGADDADTAALLDALVGAGPLGPDRVRAEVAGAGADAAQLARVAVALDRAGPTAPAHAQADAVRSALGRVDVAARYEAVGQAFGGRVTELAQLAAWITAPATDPPVPVLYVTGPPGSGKSTLVEEAARRAAGPDGGAIVVRLDFERSGLEVLDLVGLTLEVARQVATDLGDDALQQARVTAVDGSSRGPAVKGENQQHVPGGLGEALGAAVGRSGRTVLVVLDTVDELRRRGETHPNRLLLFLDQLLALGCGPMAVVAAGVGDALGPLAAARVGRWIDLDVGADVADAAAVDAAEVASAVTAPPDPVTELEARLEAGDLVEACFLHGRLPAPPEPEPGTRAADVELTFLWRVGRWAAAAELAGTHLFPHLDEGMAWWDGRSPAAAMVQLELWAELRFADAVAAFRADPALAQRAGDLCAGGIKGSMASGALGFALLAAGHGLAPSSWSSCNPAADAAAVWTGSPQRDDILALPATRLAELVSPRGGPAPVLPDPSTPLGAARLLATASPYAVATEARRRDDDGRILEHLAGVDFAVAEADGLPPTGAAGWSVAPAMSPDGSVANLTGLGLLAEWLGAAAFVLDHPDLRLLALGAERWRRTVAGDWTYPVPPPAAAGEWALRPDPTIADRIEQLLARPDPRAAADAELQLWAGDAAAVDVDLPGGDPVELLADGVPSAFVPPLAVRQITSRKDERR